MKNLSAVRCLLVSLSCWLAGCAASAPQRSDWDPEALEQAHDIVAKIRGAGIECEDVLVQGFAFIASDYVGRLPMPSAMISCTAQEDEDLTIEIFDSRKHAEDFIQTKHAIVCRSTNIRKARIGGDFPVFPGFPYAIGENWIIEPDHPETTEALAKLLGGESRQVPCVYVAPEEDTAAKTAP